MIVEKTRGGPQVQPGHKNMRGGPQGQPGHKNMRRWRRVGTSKRPVSWVDRELYVEEQKRRRWVTKPWVKEKTTCKRAKGECRETRH